MDLFRAVQQGVSRFWQGQDAPYDPDVTTYPNVRRFLDNAQPKPLRKPKLPSSRNPVANATRSSEQDAQGGETPFANSLLPTSLQRLRTQATQTPILRQDRVKRKFVHTSQEVRRGVFRPMEESRQEFLSTFQERVQIFKQSLEEEEWDVDWGDEPVQVSEAAWEEANGYILNEFKPRKTHKVSVGQGTEDMDEMEGKWEQEELEVKKQRVEAKRKHLVRGVAIDAKRQQRLALQRMKYQNDPEFVARLSETRALRKELGLKENDKFYGIMLPTVEETKGVGHYASSCSEEEYVPEQCPPSPVIEKKAELEASLAKVGSGQIPKYEKHLAAPQTSEAHKVGRIAQAQDEKDKPAVVKSVQLPSISFHADPKPDEMTNVEGAAPHSSAQKCSEWPTSASVPTFGAALGDAGTSKAAGPDLFNQPFQVPKKQEEAQLPKSSGFTAFKFGGQVESLTPVKEGIAEGFSTAKRALSLQTDTIVPSFVGQPFPNDGQVKPAGIANRRIARVKRKGASSQSQEGDPASRSHFGGLTSDMECDANSGATWSHTPATSDNTTFAFGSQPNQQSQGHNPFTNRFGGQTLTGAPEFGAQPNSGPQMFRVNAPPTAANHLGNQQMVFSVPGAPQPNPLGQPSPMFGEGGPAQFGAPGNTFPAAPMAGSGSSNSFGAPSSSISFGSGAGAAFAHGTNNTARSAGHGRYRRRKR